MNTNHARKFTLLIAVITCLVQYLQAAEPIKCPDTRDVWLSVVDEHGETNGGKAPRMKMKCWQEFGLLDFDVSALKGKKIEKAVLFVAPDGGAVFGGSRGTDLRWFTVSTVSSDWVEGDGAQYAKDVAGKGATFNESSYKTRPWSYPGSRCWDVTLGNGKSLRCDVDAGDPQNGWFAITLDKRLVEALVAKAGYGFMLMDGSTGVDRNCYVASRESNRAPYLLVTLAGDNAQAPKAPTGLSLTAAPNDASTTNGAAALTLTVPENAFAYQIKINGSELPRWQIPFAGAAGTKQTIPLEYLTPDADVSLEIAVVDASGNVSPAATVKGKASPKITVPKLPESDWKPKGGDAPAAEGKLKAWAYPEISKIDPISGKIVCEPGMDEAMSKNSVWDAASSTVRIVAARGEIASFQLAVQTLGDSAAGIKIKLDGIDDIKTRAWRTWFVNIKKQWQGDYAIPFPADAALTIPAADNKIPGQKVAAVALDLIIPESAKAGERTGTITIGSDGAPEIKLTLKLKIYDADIPKEPHFNPEMNCYGGPGEAGSDFFFDSFRLAHYNRSTINRVPYSQNGNVHADYAPKVGTDGKVSDWTTFDKNLGPLLDGSAFKDNPRAGVPVPTLYLPMAENWPLPMLPNYNPGETFTGKNWNPIHHIKAKPPEQSFNQAYKDAFINNVADFIKHFEDKGWTKTMAEVFFNNKSSFSPDGIRGTAWIMDEPFVYLDWNALGFFSKLAHQAMKNQKTAHVIFRADVSRPMWQGSCMDGLMELLCANNEQFEMFPLMKDHKRRMPTTLYTYGACNDQSRANHETTAWCLKAYVYECDGVLPWQSLGEDNAFDIGDGDGGNGNALIVDGRKRFGVNAIASYRVHAFRVGAQLVELLRLLELKNHWGRSHSDALVSQLIQLRTEFHQSSTDEAAAVTFKNLNGDQFVHLKEGILKLLEK
jgi:hypothetical protein